MINAVHEAVSATESNADEKSDKIAETGSPVKKLDESGLRTMAVICKSSGDSMSKAIVECLNANEYMEKPMSKASIEKMVKSAYGFEADGARAFVEKLNERHAVVDVGGKFRVMKEYIDPDTGLEDISLSAPADFRAF